MFCLRLWKTCLSTKKLSSIQYIWIENKCFLIYPQINAIDRERVGYKDLSTGKICILETVQPVPKYKQNSHSFSGEYQMFLTYFPAIQPIFQISLRAEIHGQSASKKCSSFVHSQQTKLKKLKNCLFLPRVFQSGKQNFLHWFLLL